MIPLRQGSQFRVTIHVDIEEFCVRILRRDSNAPKRGDRVRPAGLVNVVTETDIGRDCNPDCRLDENEIRHGDSGLVQSRAHPARGIGPAAVTDNCHRACQFAGKIGAGDIVGDPAMPPMGDRPRLESSGSQRVFEVRRSREVPGSTAEQEDFGPITAMTMTDSWRGRMHNGLAHVRRCQQRRFFRVHMRKRGQRRAEHKEPGARNPQKMREQAGDPGRAMHIVQTKNQAAMDPEPSTWIGTMIFGWILTDDYNSPVQSCPAAAPTSGTPAGSVYSA